MVGIWQTGKYRWWRTAADSSDTVMITGGEVVLECTVDIWYNDDGTR